MRKLLTILILFVVTILIIEHRVSACPMCRVALEDATQADNRPAAYMASILFMLTMPFMIFGTIGGVLFYLNKQEQELANKLTAEAMKNKTVILEC